MAQPGNGTQQNDALAAFQQAQFTGQLHLPSNAVNGQMGAELAEAWLKKEWWSIMEKAEDDTRVRKVFCWECAPQAPGGVEKVRVRF